MTSRHTTLQRAWRRERAQRQVGVCAVWTEFDGRSDVPWHRRDSRYGFFITRTHGTPRVLGIVRGTGAGEERMPSPQSSTVLQAGDTLLFNGSEDALARSMEELRLTLFTPTERNVQRWLWELGAATVLIHPESKLIG